jgi:hypothetical protein
VQADADVGASKSFRKLKTTFDEIGVRHEVARVTDDGIFSTDIYLPEHGRAVVGLYTTLTPPDPYLKGAWYPGGFNP